MSKVLDGLGTTNPLCVVSASSPSSVKQDYINSTESVIKLLRVVRDNSCSPPKGLAREFSQVYDSDRIDTFLGYPFGQLKKRERKNTRERTVEDRQILLFRSRAKQQPHLPSINPSRIYRVNTELEKRLIELPTNKETLDFYVRLQNLRSKNNIGNQYDFELSLNKDTWQIPPHRRRHITGRYTIDGDAYCGPSKKYTKRSIAKLERVLVEGDTCPYEPRKRNITLAKEPDYTAWETNEQNLWTSALSDMLSTRFA